MPYRVVSYCVKNSLHKRRFYKLFTQAPWSHTRILTMGFSNLWKQCCRFTSFTQYKNTCLTAFSSPCLAALPAEMSAFSYSSSDMRQNAYYRNLKRTFEDLRPCCCTQERPTVEQSAHRFRQHASAGKGTDMSEMQALHCMTPEQRRWLLCSVSVIPANKLSLQARNQLILALLLTSVCLQIFDS